MSPLDVWSLCFDPAMGPAGHLSCRTVWELTVWALIRPDVIILALSLWAYLVGLQWSKKPFCTTSVTSLIRDYNTSLGLDIAKPDYLQKDSIKLIQI